MDAELERTVKKATCAKDLRRLADKESKYKDAIMNSMECVNMKLTKVLQ